MCLLLGAPPRTAPWPVPYWHSPNPFRNIIPVMHLLAWACAAAVNTPFGVSTLAAPGAAGCLPSASCQVQLATYNPCLVITCHLQNLQVNGPAMLLHCKFVGLHTDTTIYTYPPLYIYIYPCTYPSNLSLLGALWCELHQVLASGHCLCSCHPANQSTSLATATTAMFLGFYVIPETSKTRFQFCYCSNRHACSE